jgi:hypothetical protein
MPQDTHVSWSVVLTTKIALCIGERILDELLIDYHFQPISRLAAVGKETFALGVSYPSSPFAPHYRSTKPKVVVNLYASPVVVHHLQGFPPF